MESENQNQGQGQKKKTWANIIFFIVAGLVVFGSVGYTYYKIMIKRDYLVSMQIECDPYVENCFIYNCNPETEKCSSVPEENVAYYEIINKKAFNYPSCNPNTDENCVIDCSEGEADCSITLCDAQTATEGVECNDSVEFTKNNPPEEEEVECEEGDEECLQASEESEECDPADEECLTAQNEETSLESETQCDPKVEDCNTTDGAEENEAASE